jgi:glyoxylase-like metal-dependent hydrolase (beta-lactamase superfamily II)
VLAIGASFALASAASVGATTPELPPNAGGYVAICPDAASGGLQTVVVPADETEALLTEGSSGAPCAVAPGADAYGPMPDPETGMYVGEIADGIHWVTEGVYQAMFVVTDEGVIVVDAPPSIPDIVGAIASVTDQPITHVIYSHSHADHIAGAGAYPPDATYIAHAETAAQLEASLASNPMWGAFVGGGPVPVPTETFDDSYTLTVGSQILELSTPSVLAHEPGNIFIYAPAQNVLAVIDLIFPGWSPFKDLGQAEDVVGYLAAHDEILGFGADTLVTGHLGRLGTNADVELNLEYMADVQAAALAALQSVALDPIVAETGFTNPWLLFDSYFDELVSACEVDVVPQWTDRLAGADVFTADHCYKIIESMRID